MKNFEIKNNRIYLADSIPSEAADFIVSKFDNFYDANGLIDLWVGISDANENRIIEPVWNADYKQPDDEELVKLLETWYDDWKGVVQYAIEAANVS